MTEDVAGEIGSTNADYVKPSESSGSGITVPVPIVRSIAWLSQRFPSAAAALAGYLFHNPLKRDRYRGRDILARGTRFDIVDAGLKIAGWKWGQGPLVTLVHGWGSSAGGMADLVRPLEDSGFSVVAFDMPGHGQSRGKPLLPYVVKALKMLDAEFGRLPMVVGHSFGGMSVAAAIQQGVPIDRAVLIAPPRDLTSLSVRFGMAVGISEQVRLRMQRNSEARTGIRFDTVDTRLFGANQNLPLLIIHDKDDPDIPWTDGEEISRAWVGAELMITESLGHRRILKDPSVHNAVVGFLRGCKLE